MITLMYKKRFIFLTTCFFLTVHIHGQEIDSVVIKYVNMWSKNAMNITCCDFIEHYKDANKVVITDYVKIQKFMDALILLPHGKVRKNKFTILMDTRAQIYIYRNNCNCTTVICLELLGLMIGNDYFRYSGDFLQVLEQYIPKEFLPYKK